jgi:hypothetical protein
VTNLLLLCFINSICLLDWRSRIEKQIGIESQRKDLDGWNTIPFVVNTKRWSSLLEHIIGVEFASSARMRYVGV